MKKLSVISMLTSASFILAACNNTGDDTKDMSFPIQNTQGAEIGTLQLEAIQGGGVAVQVSVTGLEPGKRAMQPSR